MILGCLDWIAVPSTKETICLLAAKRCISFTPVSEAESRKSIILKYKVLQNFKYNNKDYTVVKVDLQTGRHHQIRLQFAGISHPLFGDVKYGSNVNKSGHNIALFSYYLSFYHPTKDEYLEFKYFPNEMINMDKIWSNVNYGNR